MPTTSNNSHIQSMKSAWWKSDLHCSTKATSVSTDYFLGKIQKVQNRKVSVEGWKEGVQYLNVLPVPYKRKRKKKE